ncbi:MAG: hypothetical protein H6627_13615 [Calditrichae bacterium]|nr:hypothetical protein [Calditrichota bacterium]MCB9059605.1 hypothetical protein [Calditrichia bacterium]
MAEYIAEFKTVLDDLLLAHPAIRAGKMFGFPAYYSGKKLCICLYGQGVGIKLPAESAENLLKNDANVIPFQPMGRAKMREWVQINLPRAEDYRDYLPVFEESITFLLSK